MSELVDAAFEPFGVFRCTADKRRHFLDRILQSFVQCEQTLQAVALREQVLLFRARGACELFVNGVEFCLRVVDLGGDSGGGLGQTLLLRGLAIVRL